MDRLIKNRKQDYSYQFASVMHHAMTHVSLKRGPNQLKEKGENAVFKELLQLLMKSALIPLKAGDLTEREKYEALELLMFLK